MTTVHRPRDRVVGRRADEARDRLREAYDAVWPDGRSRVAWPHLIYIHVRPTWVRYGDYTGRIPEVVEFTAADLVR